MFLDRLEGAFSRHSEWTNPASPFTHSRWFGETWLIREQVIGSLFFFPGHCSFYTYIYILCFRPVIFIPEGTGEWDESEDNMQHSVAGQIQTGGRYRVHVVSVLVG